MAQGKTGKQPRSFGTTEERRARRGALGGIKKRLPLPAECEADKKHSYRYVKDVGTRIHDFMYNDTWDLVNKSGENVGLDKGSAYQYYSGTKENGDPETVYLMKKPIDHYNEDKVSQQVSIDEKMNQIRQGAKSVTDTKLAGVAYDPKEGIKL